ncbi:tyrosine-protein phosphatase [Priestia abyssalis]|uniref:tyrosine-protein phosphatase n=1 Tax=Priestia abyssalis TaxID=1221450 RepID=UPI000994C88B|nr:CpsB/CapC family capsule biosynthesis tyrosine phosphatase [Priestia abyssalis]
MIDVHCHILPNVDAGPKNVTASLEMAKQVNKQGVHTIVAAPSYLNESFQNEKTAIVERVNTYAKLLAEHNIPLKVLPGQEIHLTEDLLEMFEEGKLLTINDNGKYLLLACPEHELPSYIENLLYEMQLKGLVPIISQPERNERIMGQPDIIYQLVKKGALVQLGAASIQGAFGAKVKKFAFQLLKANLAHVIASGAYQSRDSYSLKDAYAEIKKKAGIEKLYMLQENADYIVKGQMVHREQPVRIGKKRFGIF